MVLDRSPETCLSNFGEDLPKALSGIFSTDIFALDNKPFKGFPYKTQRKRVTPVLWPLF